MEVSPLSVAGYVSRKPLLPFLRSLFSDRLPFSALPTFPNRRRTQADLLIVHLLRLN